MTEIRQPPEEMAEAYGIGFVKYCKCGGEHQIDRTSVGFCGQNGYLATTYVVLIWCPKCDNILDCMDSE